MPIKIYLGTLYLNYRQSKRKKNLNRRQRKNTLPIEQQRKEFHPNCPQKPCKQEENGVKYLKYWEGKNHQIRILYPVELSIKSKGIYTLSDKEK